MWSSPPPPPPPLSHPSLKQQYYLFIIIGMALIVIIVLLANVFAIGYCTWFWQVFYSQPSPPLPPPGLPIGVVQSWIPAYEYKKEAAAEAEEECAVCLSAFADGEMVRKFLQCGHTFHVPCIDLWFRSSTNCPICRSMVLPSSENSTEMRSQEAMLPRRNDGFTISDIL